MAVKILRYVERRETDIMQHTLTDEQYAEFLERRKHGNTAELGAWINSITPCTYYDSYGGYVPGETVQIFDDREKEYIQD
ncbi:hypothetical protein NVD72_004425 [Salmonella enterica]|nr:hypothetical protein [Salmonella enterica]EJP1063914.1 hypothetical protein [Salmonella enterica]EJP1108709.1 hypothetical protein [Salmonella enterica]EKN1463240.1 hypothetical protein [Salmonella enterica]